MGCLDLLTPAMHIGRNIRKVRELLEVKQESLAELLKVSQQTISKIEQTEYLTDKAIERIANALNIPATVIVHFSEQAIVEYLKDFPKSNFATGNEVEYLKLFESIIDLYGQLLKLKYKKI